MERTLKTALCILLVLAIHTPVWAQGSRKSADQDPTLTRILFVFDASNSMFGLWQSDRKINIAKRMMSELLDSIESTPNVEYALRIYGHQKSYPPQDCDDTRLEVSFGPSNVNKIKQKINQVVPKGTTPIARTLEACATDFPRCSHCRNIVVLITDGIEECSGDPCAVSRELQKNGIILKPFIIGVGRDFSADFECVGQYFDATSEKAFRTALNVVIAQALNSTTMQVNLLDQYEKPTETNVNMTFYDHYNGQIRYNFVHTMTTRGVPDTLVIDPLSIYDIVVHTLPPVRKDSIRLTPGKHTVIGIDAPQGYLALKVGGQDNLYKDLQCIVRKQGESTTLHVQGFREPEKYITGKYDLEVLTLPRLKIRDVEISQSKTTEVIIPVPGLAQITYPVKGFGSLYVDNGKTLEWIQNLNSNALQETLILQPGSYRIIFRSRFATRSFQTLEKEFMIKSGESLRIQITQ
ncbi:MAG TPA: VWA domain-containing protein [Bacteroidales bacterium]|nr:VWA domain-containing protein [Bacteroidales bacterium]HRZ48338.1 VWA domain-containing protein [Bacteroidales bacterium]